MMILMTQRITFQSTGLKVFLRESHLSRNSQPNQYSSLVDKSQPSLLLTDSRRRRLRVLVTTTMTLKRNPENLRLARQLELKVTRTISKMMRRKVVALTTLSSTTKMNSNQTKVTRMKFSTANHLRRCSQHYLLGISLRSL